MGRSFFQGKEDKEKVKNLLFKAISSDRYENVKAVLDKISKASGPQYIMDDKKDPDMSVDSYADFNQVAGSIIKEMYHYGDSDIIMNAVSHKLYNSLRALLETDWVVNALRDKQIGSTGITALHVACLNQDVEAMKLLADNGYSSIPDKDGRTPQNYFDEQRGYDPAWDFEFHDKGAESSASPS